MSINSFISSAKELYKIGHYNESLCLVCIAIDSCAALAYPEVNVTERYKKFLSDHFRTISENGFPGISANSIRIKVNAKIDSLKLDNSGYVDMNQIIYHTIRCGLVHNCEIEKSIIFTDQTIIGNWEHDKFYIPQSLIWGLIAATEETLN